MKKIYLLLHLCFICGFYASATQRTVNNNNPSPGTYSTIQAAVTAASNGDTLLIAGSPTNYGTVTLNKKLTLIGPGYNPQKQNPQVSFLGTLDINSVLANGSSIMGIYFTGSINLSINALANLTIKRNFFGSSGVYFYATDTVNNIQISENIFSTN